MSCLIVQSDKTLLLEVDHEQADDCRRAIAPFAELERAPEHIHTYRVTPLGLWNARAHDRGFVRLVQDGGRGRAGPALWIPPLLRDVPGHARMPFMGGPEG